MCYTLYVYVWLCHCMPVYVWLYCVCVTVCLCMYLYVRGSVIAKIVGHNVIEHKIFVQHVPVWVKEELFNGKKLTDIINTKHENIRYLPGCIIPYNVVCSQSYLLFNTAVCISDVTVFKLKLKTAGFKVEPRNRTKTAVFWRLCDGFLEFQKWPSPITGLQQ